MVNYVCAKTVPDSTKVRLIKGPKLKFPGGGGGGSTCPPPPQKKKAERILVCNFHYDLCMFVLQATKIWVVVCEQEGIYLKGDRGGIYLKEVCLVLERTSYTLSCTKVIHVHGTCGILDNAHHRELKQVQNND